MLLNGFVIMSGSTETLADVGPVVRVKFAGKNSSINTFAAGEVSLVLGELRIFINEELGIEVVPSCMKELIE